jgi:hypothetical protein
MKAAMTRAKEEAKPAMAATNPAESDWSIPSA